MPIELEPYALDTHVPVIAVLAEQLQQGAEAALAATTETDQLVRVMPTIFEEFLHGVAAIVSADIPISATGIVTPHALGVCGVYDDRGS